MHSDRLVIVSVPTSFLVELFDAIAQRPPAVRVPYFEQLPLDGQLRCEGVEYRWDRRCFDVLFSHPSFAEVPVGEPPPRLGRTWTQWAALPEYQPPADITVEEIRNLRRQDQATFQAMYQNEWPRTPASNPLPMKRDPLIKDAIDRLHRMRTSGYAEPFVEPKYVGVDDQIAAHTSRVLSVVEAAMEWDAMTRPPSRVMRTLPAEDDVAPTAVVGE